MVILILGLFGIVCKLVFRIDPSLKVWVDISRLAGQKFSIVVFWDFTSRVLAVFNLISQDLIVEIDFGLIVLHFYCQI